MKYLMGLSIIYTPFFFLGHCIAGALEYPQDGFSTPYPLSICFVPGLCCIRFFLVKKGNAAFFFRRNYSGCIVVNRNGNQLPAICSC